MLLARAGYVYTLRGTIKRSLRSHVASQHNSVTTGAQRLQAPIRKSAGVQLNRTSADLSRVRRHRTLPTSPTSISIFGVTYPQGYQQAHKSVDKLWINEFTLFMLIVDKSVYKRRLFSFNRPQVMHRVIHNSNKRWLRDVSNSRLKHSFRIRHRIDEVSYIGRTL